MNSRGQSGVQHMLYIIRLYIIPSVETQVPPSIVNARGLHCDLHADIGVHSGYYADLFCWFLFVCIFLLV